MIAPRTPASVLLLALAACAAAPEADDDDGPVPRGEPAVRVLVNAHPEDDASDFVDASEARYGDPFARAAASSRSSSARASRS